MQSRLVERLAFARGGATLQLWSEFVDVGNQIGQQILRPEWPVWLQEIGDIDDRVVIGDDAYPGIVERGNAHRGSSPCHIKARPSARAADFATIPSYSPPSDDRLPDGSRRLHAKRLHMGVGCDISPARDGEPRRRFL